jgi:hypothetical protein
MTAHRTSLMLAIASALLLAGGNAALAQLRVDGKPEAVHVEARDVPLQEVLSVLHDRFGLQYRSDDTLETRKTGRSPRKASTCWCCGKTDPAKPPWQSLRRWRSGRR